MNCFFCDVSGTYSGEDFDREYEVKRFVDNLSKIIEIENLENLYFSFVSSDDYSYVKKYIDELEKNIVDKRIKCVCHVCGTDYYNDNKIYKIDLTNKFSQITFLMNNKEFNNIYIADDSLINQEIIKECLFDYLKEKNNDKNIIPFNNMTLFTLGQKIDDNNEIGLKKRDLSGLNDVLESYIMKLYKKKIKIKGIR